MYKRSKRINYCLGDNTSDYIKKRNYYLYRINIDKIKNRKNKFLPKINSQRIILKAPKRKEEQKIQEENFKIFRNLFSIDYRLPVLSEKKYLNQKYIKELKRERSEINRYHDSIITNIKSGRKLLISPIKYNKNKDKYELYIDKTAF